MYGPSPATVGAMVSPERALEHMSVEKAWSLLDTLSSQVVGKQTELQLMVGSRYHELIESADSIVSMKETGEEVLGLLRKFPQACSNVLHQVPSSLSPGNSDLSGTDVREDAAARHEMEVVQLMLHAPAAMWAALDSNKVLEAANLVLRCRSSWTDLSSTFSTGMDSGVAAFLRGHVTYVEQFPRRILSAGTRLLTRSCNTLETAGALTAILQLQALEDANPLRCLLELLLRRRGGAVVAMLTRATKEENSAQVEQVLHAAVTTVQRTIVDVHAIFAPGRNGSCMLEDLAHPSYRSQASLRLSAHDAKDMCTTWLSVLTPKIRAFSERLLRATGDTNSLARIRGSLWKATHGDGAWATPAAGTRVGGSIRAVEGPMWMEATSFTVNVSAFDGGTNDSTRAWRQDVSSPQLDLWSLLFSQIFAELAEALLKDSLASIRRDVECRLDSILLAITRNETGQGVQKARSSSGSHRQEQPHALMAHDILAAADAVVSLLTSEIRNLAGDATCLTERGDQTAADALKTSFYLLSVDMAADLANHLRIALQEIHACIKSTAEQERRCVPYGGGIGDLENAVSSFADAGLLIGRVAWMLNGRSGQPLQYALTPPACFAQRRRGRIEEQQLEAAFVIADTNGDGVVDTEEAAEALQAVSFGASAALAVDPSRYASFTLNEFFLFATRLLEEQRPRQHLTSCLDTLLSESLAVWSEWALEKSAALLTEGCNALAILCSNPGMTNDLWRQAHGIWEDKTIELDRDDGDGIQETVHFPIMVSPAILCYIEGVAAELSRILSTADLIERAVTESCSGWKTQDAQSPGYAERALGWSAPGKATVQGAARYARSLAAVRASSDLSHALIGLCEGAQSAAAQACEAAQLQLLLDALFLQKWVSDSPKSSPSMDSVVTILCDLVDPINLQIYMPHLQTAASACWAACHTPLSLIFEQATPSSSAPSSASVSPDGALGSSSSFIPLAPKARRFEILPLSLDVVRLQHPNGSSRSRNSVGIKSGAPASGDGPGASAQARGLEAGRQALAGLGSVLSAQNAHVQSVFGAASLFLGGRNRRGEDGDGHSER
ncbi:unnamed protein product [Ectocarpus sp. 13 AM-2016]